MTNDSSVRDGATGASELIARLESFITEEAYWPHHTEAGSDAVAELRRHLCECGHWMREHAPVDDPCEGLELWCDSEGCQCYDFTPEESDALTWDDLNRAKELADIALEESDV